MVGVYEWHVLNAWIIYTMTNIDDTHLEMFNKVFIEKIDLVQDSEETELFNLGTTKKLNVIAQSFG